MTDPLLDRARLVEAFRRLGDRLAHRGVVADVYVFGGAAMALAYDLRRSTRDVDALLQPHDAEDIRSLVAHLELTTADQVLAMCAEVFPDEPVPRRAQLLLDDLLPS